MMPTNQLSDNKYLTNSTMELYIFDFDGTLGDSRGLILRTMMDTFDYFGINRPTEEACIETIGLPLTECFTVSAHLSDEDGEKCADKYREIFKRNNVKGAVKPFDGVIQTLHSLKDKGKTLAVASSRRHESLDGLIEDFGITDMFSAIIGADDVVNAKPDPEPVNKVLSELSFSARDTIVIGDAPYDIIMANNAGATACAVTYGNGKRKELEDAGADFLIDKFADLLTLPI